MFSDIGLISPIKVRNEITVNINTTIDKYYQQFIKCLQSLIEFERQYTYFSQLIPEWRTNTPSNVKNEQIKNAKNDIQNFLYKIREHPFM